MSEYLEDFCFEEWMWIMKITKTAKECLVEDQIRKAALVGCDKCPCCGEDKSAISYYKDGITNKGIIPGTCKNWYGKKHETDRVNQKSIDIIT